MMSGCTYRALFVDDLNELYDQKWNLSDGSVLIFGCQI